MPRLQRELDPNSLDLGLVRSKQKKNSVILLPQSRHAGSNCILLYSMVLPRMPRNISQEFKDLIEQVANAHEVQAK